jgi:hypothetical protein
VTSPLALGRRLAALGLITATSACVTGGRDFRSDLGWMKENQTKQKDVKLVLGDPDSVGQSGAKPTWTYQYYRYRLIGPDHRKELKIYWNADGTVSTFSYNSSFPDDTKGTQSPRPPEKEATY